MTALSATLWEKRHLVLLPNHPIGFMSVNICASNRVRLATDDPFAGDPKFLALDAKGYLSYCGPFSVVSENEVIDHLKLCSFENWVGTDQRGHAQLDLDKDTLTLSTAPVLTRGRKGSNRLTWEAYHFDASRAVDKLQRFSRTENASRIKIAKLTFLCACI